MDELTMVCAVSLIANVMLLYLFYQSVKENMELIDDCFSFISEITKLRMKIKKLEEK